MGRNKRLSLGTMASCESLKWNIPVFPFYQFIRQFDKTDMISYSHVPPNIYFLREKKPTKPISFDLDSWLDDCNRNNSVLMVNWQIQSS